MIEKRKKSKNPTNFYGVLGIIGDCLFFPIIFLSLVSSIVMLFQKSKNYIPSFFGHSIVKVLSPSMVRDGFDVGDIVLVNKNYGNLKVGDIVAFYYANKNLTSTPQKDLVKVQSIISNKNDNVSYTIKNDTNIHTINEKQDLDLTPIKDVKEKNKIYFHYIVGIYLEESTGHIYYQTCGSGSTNNHTFENDEGLYFGQYPESYFTREDLIVGTYSNTPIFIRKALVFMGSSLGMILLVCLPLFILIITQSLSLIEQVNVFLIEKKIMQRKIKLDDKEIESSYNPNTMEPINKILFIYKSPMQERDYIKNIIWSETFESENVIDKKNARYINSAIIKLNKNDEKGFFDDMKMTLSNRDQKSIDNEIQSIYMLRIMKESQDIKL